MKLSTYHIALAFLILPLSSVAQWVGDKCFNSVSPAENFNSSSLIANIGNMSSDMYKYQDGEWQGSSQNLNLQPPVQCDASKAAFLQFLPGDSIPGGIGLKLSGGMGSGNQLSFEFTYVSKGQGSDGSFSPAIYTHDEPELFVNGIAQGTYVQSLPNAGNEWETNTLTFTVSNQSSGDDWIFLVADESSGLLLNMCQLEVDPIDYGPNEEVNACEGESVVIGESLGEGVSYAWSNGSTGATIEVSAAGFYSVQASNNCSSTSKSFLVVYHNEPNLLPDEELFELCAGDSIQLSSQGLNPIVTWPDGSNDSLHFISTEGVFNILVSDDCDEVTYLVEVDFDTIPVLDLGPDISLCEGQTITLDATVLGDSLTYAWQDGSWGAAYFVDSENTYTVTAWNNCGSVSDDIFVEYSLVPKDVLPDVQEICEARYFEFDVSDIEGDYVWSTGETTAIISPQYTGTYWVEIWDDDNCFYVLDSVLVVEGPCFCPIYIPNAFTPDDDGLNDVWQSVFECPPYDFLLEIYDRWGVVVHRSTNPSAGWDGKFGKRYAPSGIYGYRVWYRETFHGIPIEKFGSVALFGGKLE